MKKIFTYIVLITIVFIQCAEKSKFPELKGSYLGQTPPGMVPELFAPNVISTSLFTRDLTMTPDGEEIYFSVSMFGYNLIYFTKLVDGIWTEPQPASFISNYDYMYYEPHILSDGMKMFFLSNMVDQDSVNGDEDIWVVDRMDDSWGEPYNLGEPVNTEDGEFYPSTTKSGTLYFTRQKAGDPIGFIYRSRLENGKYSTPEKLGPNVNCGSNRYNAYVDREEKFIIVPAEGMEDRYGRTDYYIVFRDDNDNWSEPINMGGAINSISGREYSASVSPDGKYLFFMSGRGNFNIDFNEELPAYSKILELFNSPQNGNSNIFWVDVKVIDDLRPGN
ncbi:MAG: hypothetical protein PVF17_01830 [Ignavibacteria bacterium]|jgi:hypothetical protein